MDSFAVRRRSVLFLILAAVLWSTGGLMIKSSTWQPLAIMVGRNIFSSAMLILYLRRLPTRWNRWKLIAAVSHLLTAFLFISSTKLTTSANAIFLQYTAPLYIILLAFWFLRERPTRTDWLSMLVIFSGMFLFFGDKLSLEGLHGNILAALSGVTMAMMTVSLRAQKDGTPIESILIAQVFTVAFGFPLLFRESWTTTNWLIVAYLGIFQIGLAFLLFTSALKHVPAMEATLIGTLEPILNPLWVAFFLGEKPGTFATVGAVIVLAGVIFNSIGNARAAPATAEATTAH
ncbi:MAG TPA: EamA family transporter [Anaerolineales bacterium]|nr:EamA family transporter [Anaerolineales bacterium]